MPIAYGLRLPVDALLTGYFIVIVIGIGLAARRAIVTSEDWFLSGRSLPGWITGIAFTSANLGAIEVLGNAADGAQSVLFVSDLGVSIAVSIVTKPRTHAELEGLVWVRRRPSSGTPALTTGTRTWWLSGIAAVLIIGMSVAVTL
jgi:hypothetical protein